MQFKEFLKKIVTFHFNNISLIYRIILAFVFIICIFTVSSVLTGSKQMSVEAAFSNVENESMPITRGAYEIQVLMLEANQYLLNIKSLESDKEVLASATLFRDAIKRLQVKLADFEKVLQESVNLQATNPKMLLSLKQLKQRINHYISLTNALPELKVQYLKHKLQLSKHQNEFQALMSLMTKELQRISSIYDDPYINSLMLDLDKIRFEIEDGIYTSFKSVSPQVVMQKLKVMPSLIEAFKKQIDVIQLDIPHLKGDMESIYFVPMYTACTDKNGVLNATFNLLVENEKIADQTLQGEKAIKAAQERLAFLQDLADQYSKSVSENVHKNMDEAMYIFLIGLVIVLLVVAVISLGLIKGIKKPIHNLVSVMEKLSHGDLTVKCKVKGDDEFAQIGRGLNNVIESDRNVISNIIEIVKKLKETSSNNCTVVDGLDKSLDVQKREAFMVASATSELEQTLSLVVESAQHTLDEVTNVAHISEQGREIMSSNITTTHSLDSKLQNTSSAISKVDEMGEKIGNVVSVIRGIAEQTNLLALNAAIEAARAGEHGRGFAVVADEVRTLANRTSESTKTISAVIDELRATINHAVEVITTCNEEMTSSIEQSSKANSSLEEIMGFIQSIEQMTSQIVESSHEQDVATREINQNINRISELTEKSCDGMHDIRTSSDTLNTIAEEQLKIVSRFKI